MGKTEQTSAEGNRCAEQEFAPQTMIMSSYIEQRDDYWIAKDDEGYGTALIIKTPWSSRYLGLIAKHGIKTIRLNERLGWPDSDISFLLSIPGIHGVTIMSDNVTDISPIFQLKKLKTLSLYCKAKVAGDFVQLENLESVGLGWRSVYQSFFGLNTLKRISVIAFPDKDLTRWKRNEWLKELRLESKELESLTGVDRFPNLNWLDLYRCRKAHSLAPLASTTSIQKLSIDRCPGISDLAPVSHLTQLKELEIEDCGDIESLAPVAKCKKLESLQVAGKTTVLNGDFSSLKKLPELKRVLLAHRKHYSHTADELERK